MKIINVVRFGNRFGNPIDRLVTLGTFSHFSLFVSLSIYFGQVGLLTTLTTIESRETLYSHPPHMSCHRDWSRCRLVWCRSSRWVFIKKKKRGFALCQLERLVHAFMTYRTLYAVCCANIATPDCSVLVVWPNGHFRLGVVSTPPISKRVFVLNANVICNMIQLPWCPFGPLHTSCGIVHWK